MRVRVLFFGVLKDLIGRATDDLTLPPGAKVEDLLRHYEAEVPRLAGYASALATSVNQQYAARSAALKENDEVALLPPVSGGKDTATATAPMVRIMHSRIVPHEIVPALERPEDGAIVMFDGTVRNHSRGRRTLYLEYEAYEPMALAEMQRLAAQALEKFAVRNLALVHRLGRIEIGQSSVFIAVVSAHRAAAFDACRWLIDTLKRTVPIWKKEFFEDGAIWADGEPFPPNVSSDAAPAAASPAAATSAVVITKRGAQ